MRLWRDRSWFENEEGAVNLRGISSLATAVSKEGQKTARLKAKAGLGRKKERLVYALHKDLRAEFDRMSAQGVKFNLTTLKPFALHILKNSDSPHYSANMTHPRKDLPLHQKITLCWIQGFTCRYQIVIRAHTGKYMRSLAKEKEVDVMVAAYLGTNSILFSSERIDEKHAENADKTQIFLNVDNRKTLEPGRDAKI